MKENYWRISTAATEQLNSDMSFINEQDGSKDKLYQEQRRPEEKNEGEARRRKSREVHPYPADGLNRKNSNLQQQQFSINPSKPHRNNIDNKQPAKTFEDDNNRKLFKRFAKGRDKSSIELVAAASGGREEDAIERLTKSKTTAPTSKEPSTTAAKQQQPQQLVKKDEKEVNLSFCGCGFLGIYHVGVASCFHEYAPQLSMHKISGSSAGALVAVAHICGNLQLAYATTDILRVAIDARARALGPFHPSFDINATVREALERGLPEDVHLKANGKLHVSLTRVYDGENVIISEFGSKEDVIQVLLCSCFIPFWSGLVAPKYKGVTYVDGGFSNNLLILDDKTVTVSPFAGEADICPQDDTLNLLQVSLSNTSFSLTPNNLYRLSHALLPPAPEVLSDLCEQGFADGIRYLQRMNLISCTKCLEIRSSLLVTTNGGDMEEAFSNQAYSMKSSASFTDNVHIRLQQQEQKMIEINGNQRRNSVVSTTGQTFQQQQSSLKSSRMSLDRGDSISMVIGDSSVGASDDIEMDDEDVNYDLRKQRLLLGLDLANLSADEDENFNRDNSINNYHIDEDDDNNDDHQDDYQDEECDECILMRRRALCDPLPKQFSDRIRDACDTVNKSLSNWIYSHRPIKYLSYLAAPYYLPIDISLAIIYKCWKTLPFVRAELVDCVHQIVEFLIGILRRINSKSSTSRLLMAPTSGWLEGDAIEYEKEMIKHKRTTAFTTTTTTTTTTTNQSVLSSAASVSTKCGPDSPSSGASSSSSSSSSFHRQSLKITSSTIMAEPSLSSSCTSLNSLQQGVATSGPPKPTSNATRNTSTTQLHSLEDTFDSIVDVTSKQEARIFAYYFRDAKNRLQVTEIFDLQRAAELCCSSGCACGGESGSLGGSGGDSCQQTGNTCCGQPLTSTAPKHNSSAINQSRLSHQRSHH